jgi:serine/threonine-protein kinase
MMPLALGPYRVVRQLGEGGMGVVYEAVNDAIERRVAIKVLHPEYAKNAEVTARFFNEARAVNRIEHPGLVQISDYAQLPDGTVYIVMEFLRGESLASRLQRGRLQLGSALLIAWQIADALSAAHSKSIVHRDLKPDNVMLIVDTVAPSGERAKLLDFGIAKLAEAATTGQVKTRTNMLMGTPRYMAPEQCRGARETDDKADVYALGTMLYEMISGRTPFDGEGHGEIIAMHIYETPPPIQSLIADLSADVAALVHRLLTKDKDQRPAMRAVFEELGQLATSHGALFGGGVPARQSGAIAVGAAALGTARHNSTLGRSTGQRVGLSKQRSKIYAVGGCVLLLLGGGTAWRALHTSVQQPAAVSPQIGSSLPAAVAQHLPSPRMVTWTIRSEPTGAAIIRIRDGALLGKTPWNSRQAFAVGSEDLRLKLDGYADHDVTIERSGHVELTEYLEPESPPAPAATGPAEPNAKSKPKHKRGNKAKPSTHPEDNDGQVQPEP